MDIHWHRRDVRAADNVALADAAASGTVLPVFVLDPTILDVASPPRVAFMLDALESLRSWYRDHGGDLVVARGDPETVLPALATATDADRVVWNADYSGLARERDAGVEHALRERGVACATFHDAILHEPGSITTNEGDPYSVFTYFWKKWRDRPKDDPYDAPDPSSLADREPVESAGGVEFAGADLPTLAALGFDDPEATIPPASTEAARRRLADFCRGDIYRYEQRRDYPADDCTSGLSAHLKWGTIGIREVYDETVAAMAAAPDESADDSVAEFQSQLAWREFYAHVLRFNPNVVTENYKTYEHDIAWRNDPDEIEAWKRGETGYPIVDAGMRQLRAEGFVHNRVRMIVASFLTKDLLVDWRVGYDWFRKRLVDHDTANDTGGWQWAASTGTDAQPYFRIFNPTTQGERYDPDAEYITEYVPELADVSADRIHAWPDVDADVRRDVAPDYPAPLVDHDARREDALAMFEAARGD